MTQRAQLANQWAFRLFLKQKRYFKIAFPKATFFGSHFQTHYQIQDLIRVSASLMGWFVFGL
jgi:hypothetical protein